MADADGHRGRRAGARGILQKELLISRCAGAAAAGSLVLVRWASLDWWPRLPGVACGPGCRHHPRLRLIASRPGTAGPRRALTRDFASELARVGRDSARVTGSPVAQARLNPRLRNGVRVASMARARTLRRPPSRVSTSLTHFRANPGPGPAPRLHAGACGMARVTVHWHRDWQLEFSASHGGKLEVRPSESPGRMLRSQR